MESLELIQEVVEQVNRTEKAKLLASHAYYLHKFNEEEHEARYHQEINVPLFLQLKKV